ncbi:head GIN domain-containing protein [Burkholderiaceae bacterium UC74_6]
MKAIAITVAALLAACAAHAEEGKTYAPGPFSRLEVDGLAKIRLTQGDKDQVFVRGDSKIQDQVEVELNGNRLMIHTSGNWKFWRKDPLQVDVQMREPLSIQLSGASDLLANGPIKTPRLSVDISGAADVKIDSIDTGELRFDISGAGDGRVAGRAGMLVITLSGTGKIKAEDLKVNAAKVSISGAGGARLWVTDMLNVSISGIGDVDYFGSPTKVTRDTSGLGSIKALGEKR